MVPKVVGSNPISHPSMENTYYTVSYKLYACDANGKEHLREEAPRERPYQFITGMGLQLDVFEAEIAKSASGDAFDFVIQKHDAYGEHDKSKVIKQSCSIFEIDGKFDEERIYAGAIITLMDTDNNLFPATIVSVEDKEVIVDLNYPFAGYDLRYVGEIIEKRVATQEEIDGVLEMLKGGCSCGCDRDDCSDCEGCR